MLVKLFIFDKVNNSTNFKLLVKVKVTQSCLTLCNPMNFSLPGSSVHGILQARTLEWVPFPEGRDFPNSGIKPRSPALQDSLTSEPLIQEIVISVKIRFVGLVFFPIFPPCSSLKIACQEVKTYLDK